MEFLPKIDRFEFEVDKTTVDKLHRMRPSALCNMMLACAGRHADSRGFGATRKLGWVMARMVLDIKNIPLGGEKFTIETFIKNAYRGFTDRCLRAIYENGNELAAMMCTFRLRQRIPRLLRTLPYTRGAFQHLQSAVAPQMQCRGH